MTIYGDKMRKLNAINEALNAPCRWPSCPCYARRRELDAASYEMIDPALPCPTLAEIDAVLVSYFTMLACMGHRCRDPHERHMAKQAMNHPIFSDFDAALDRLNADDYSPDVLAAANANVVNLRGGRKQ